MNVSNGEKRLGFIGTGAIAQAMITGLNERGHFSGTIRVSARNSSRSAALAQRYRNVAVATDNQTIIDNCDWVFLSVLPTQAPGVLKNLKFRKSQMLISLVAGMSVRDLQQIVPSIQKVHRIIPLPPIAIGEGPLPVFPPDPELSELFKNCGEVIPLEDEEHFLICSAASSLMATHHQITASLVGWMQEQGISPNLSRTYATSFFRALASVEKNTPTSELADLADESTTEGGLNEQVLHELRELGWFESIGARLDRIAKRLKPNA